MQSRDAGSINEMGNIVFRQRRRLCACTPGPQLFPILKGNNLFGCPTLYYLRGSILHFQDFYITIRPGPNRFKVLWRGGATPNEELKRAFKIIMTNIDGYRKGRRGYDLRDESNFHYL